MGGAARLCFADAFFVTLLFEIVDFRKRSVGGGVFYGPVPNVLGFAYSHCSNWFFELIFGAGLDGRGRDILVG